jgi:hypothetical protein
MRNLGIASLFMAAAFAVATVGGAPAGYRQTTYARRFGATPEDESKIRAATEKRARKAARRVVK